MKESEKTKVIEDETTIYEIDLECLERIKSIKENNTPANEIANK